MGDIREADARAEARRMLEEAGVTQPDDIDLDRLAEAEGAEIVYDDLDGATASVMRLGSVARIRISNRITDLGAQRFTGAHEIGHLRLEHEVPFGNTNEVIERICKPLEKSRKAPERAASVFASEIVMPESLVRRYCAVPYITLAPAREIASDFITSLLASAMRITEITTERCAVAYSVLGRVKWIKRSATFPDWIPHGRRVDPTSAVADYYERGKLDPAARMLAVEAWLPRQRVDGTNVQIVEQSAAIPELGVVFTMLWIPRIELSHLDLAA
jgi:Zn-dependent peptidase ImmA (M78 family)